MAIFDKYLVNSFLRSETTTDPIPTAFYSEDFSVSLGDFTSSGDALWTRVVDEGNGDLFSARSGAITHRQTSSLNVTKVTTQESTLMQFDYKTSTEAEFDYLFVYVDNVIVFRTSGTNAWTTKQVWIHGIGSHDISFVYHKDSSYDSGTDQVWIDNVQLYNYSESAISNTETLFNRDVVFNSPITVVKGELSVGRDIVVNKNIRAFSPTDGNISYRITNKPNGTLFQQYQNGYKGVSILTTDAENYIRIQEQNTESIKIETGVSTTYPNGYSQFTDPLVKIRFGEFLGSDPTKLLVVNGQSIFRDDVDVTGVVSATGGNSTNWNTAFGWGNHAGLYLPIATVLPATKTLVANQFFTSYNSATGAFTSAQVAYSGLSGIPSTFTPSAHTLDSHSNVTITANSSGEILKWNGSAWINNTLAEAGISAVGHTHTFASLTSKPTTLAGYGITDAMLASGIRTTGDASAILINSVRPYDISSATDEPIGSNDGVITTGMWDSTEYGTQQFHDFYNNTLWIRQRNLSVWSAWKKVLDSSNYTSYTDGKYLRSDVADTKTAGNLAFSDYVKLTFGNTDESRIYSSGSETRWDLINGDLLFRNQVGSRIFTFGRTTGNLTATGTITSNTFVRAVNGLGIASTSLSSGSGLSLYGGGQLYPPYGILFAATSSLGTHGNVDGDVATYMTMNRTAGRGFIWKGGTVNSTSFNVASISSQGEAQFDGGLVVSGLGLELPTAFYSEDFSTSLGDFTTSGDALWTRVTNEGNGDLFSAVSGNITHKQYSTLQLVKSTTQESTYLQYDYKTSTEGGYDYLIVMVDDVVQKRYSGTNAWTTDGIFIHGIGSKTIKFVYWKDNSADGGTDQVWIDNVGLYNLSEKAVINTKTYINSDFNVKGDVTFTGGETHLGETTLNGRLNMTNTNGARMIRVSTNASGSNITGWNSAGQQAYSLGGSNTSGGLTVFNPSTQANIVSMGGNTTTITGGFFQMPQTTAQFRLGEFAGNDASYIAVINGTTLFRDDLTLEGAPTTSAGSFEYLTRNTSTGVVEKVSAPKVYVALITQTGTSAPVATIIQNTLSGTPVWSRTRVGLYKLTLASEFTANKTTVLMNNAVPDTALTAYSNGVDTVSVSTKTASTNLLKDGALVKATIRIEVYP